MVIKPANMRCTIVSLTVAVALAQLSSSSPLFDDIANVMNSITSIAPELSRMAPDLLQATGSVVTGGGGAAGGAVTGVTGGTTAVTTLPAVTTMTPMDIRSLHTVIKNLLTGMNIRIMDIRIP